MFFQRKSKQGWFSLFFIFLLFQPLLVGAQEEQPPLIPSPSVFDFTRGDGWGIALGISLEYESAYDGSDEYEFEIDPSGAIQWRKENHLLFWEGIELGWRARMTDRWLTQLGVRYESGRETDDSDDGRLNGLEEKDDVMVGVLENRWSFDENWKNWVAARVMFGESDFGLLGILAAGHRFGSNVDGTGTEMFLYGTFGDDDFFNRDFGITASESKNSGLEETDLDGGYRSAGISLIDRRYITNHIQLVSNLGLEYYSNEIQSSPIARQDYEVEVGVTLLYQF